MATRINVAPEPRTLIDSQTLESFQSNRYEGANVFRVEKRSVLVRQCESGRLMSELGAWSNITSAREA